MDGRPSELSLTYAELGNRLGITPDGARLRAKRMERQGRWQVGPGNDGRSRVWLPADDLPEHPPERTPDRPDGGPNIAELTAEIAELRAHVADVAEASAAARLDAAVARGERDVAVATASAKVDAAERVIAELRAMLADARRPFWRRWLGS